MGHLIRFLTIPFYLLLIGPSFLKGKETALDIVERRLKEPRPEVADKTLLESEKAKRKDLHSVASYLRNDQIADFHIDGPANVTILVQPGWFQSNYWTSSFDLNI